MYRFIRLTTKLILILALLTLIAAGVIYFFLAPKLPDTNTLKETQLQIPLRIFSSEGLLMAEFGEKRRIPVEYNDIPKPLVEAFLAAEDDRFYQHPGVDYQGIIRAAYSLLLTGEKSQGGSTITMQVARNFFLSNEKLI
jgi:penicillin-binding protein 1A